MVAEKFGAPKTAHRHLSSGLQVFLDTFFRIMVSSHGAHFFFRTRMLGARAYAELAQGQKSGCLLTLVPYLCFYCKDVEGLVAHLKRLVLEAYGRENHAS